MSNEQFRKGFSAPLAGEVACNAIGGAENNPPYPPCDVLSPQGGQTEFTIISNCSLLLEPL